MAFVFGHCSWRICYLFIVAINLQWITCDDANHFLCYLIWYTIFIFICWQYLEFVSQRIYCWWGWFWEIFGGPHSVITHANALLNSITYMVAAVWSTNSVIVSTRTIGWSMLNVVNKNKQSQVNTHTMRENMLIYILNIYYSCIALFSYRQRLMSSNSTKNVRCQHT